MELYLFVYLPVNPKMNFNPSQITWSLISTQLFSETHTWLLLLAILMHKQKDGTPR